MKHLFIFPIVLITRLKCISMPFFCHDHLDCPRTQFCYKPLPMKILKIPPVGICKDVPKRYCPVVVTPTRKRPLDT